MLHIHVCALIRPLKLYENESNSLPPGRGSVKSLFHLYSIFVFVYLFIAFSVAPTSSGSYDDFQLLLVQEDPRRTNIGIFACMGRTTDAPQVSWKTSPHESFCPDQDSNPCGERLSGWKLRTSTTRQRTPPTIYQRAVHLSDQTARMPTPIWIYTVCIWHVTNVACGRIVIDNRSLVTGLFGTLSAYPGCMRVARRHNLTA